MYQEDEVVRRHSSGAIVGNVLHADNARVRVVEDIKRSIYPDIELDEAIARHPAGKGR